MHLPGRHPSLPLSPQHRSCSLSGPNWSICTHCFPPLAPALPEGCLLTGLFGGTFRHYCWYWIPNRRCECSVLRLLSNPHPVTQLLVPLWKVLSAAARQTGYMSSVKLTGAESFRRQMSLSMVRKLYRGWHTTRSIVRASSFGFEPDWLWRPR